VPTELTPADEGVTTHEADAPDAAEPTHEADAPDATDTAARPPHRRRRAASRGDRVDDAGPRLRTARLEAFSDGVFAIAITLLVLEIGVAAGEDSDMWRRIVDEWPSYLAYVVSFSTIGAAWIAHSSMTEYLERVDATFLRLNLLLLLVVAFLPFPTRLLAEHIGSDVAERAVVTLYGATLMLVSILISVLWRWAARARLTRDDLSDPDVELVASRLTPGIGGYVVLVIVGQWWPVAAVVGFLLIAIFLLIPFPLRGGRR
jgi:uncharacterized membrane protein